MLATIDKLLELGLYAGTLLLASGAEVYRIENTIFHMLTACGADTVDCIVTPTGIHLSVRLGENSGTRVRRIEQRSTNLRRVSAINTLSRSLGNSQQSTDDVLKALEAIESETEHNLQEIEPFAAALGGTAFAALFGARGWELPLTALVSIIVFVGKTLLKERGIPGLLADFAGGSLAALCALLSTLLIARLPYEHIVLGSIMTLVPGVLLTSGVRDMLAGDLLSGVIRMAEALFTAASIAAGVGAVLGWWIKWIH